MTYEKTSAMKKSALFAWLRTAFVILAEGIMAQEFTYLLKRKYRAALRCGIVMISLVSTVSLLAFIGDSTLSAEQSRHYVDYDAGTEYVWQEPEPLSWERHQPDKSGCLNGKVLSYVPGGEDCVASSAMEETFWSTAFDRAGIDTPDSGRWIGGFGRAYDFPIFFTQAKLDYESKYRGGKTSEPLWNVLPRSAVSTSLERIAMGESHAHVCYKHDCFMEYDQDCSDGRCGLIGSTNQAISGCRAFFWDDPEGIWFLMSVDGGSICEQVFALIKDKEIREASLSVKLDITIENEHWSEKHNKSFEKRAHCFFERYFEMTAHSASAASAEMIGDAAIEEVLAYSQANSECELLHGTQDEVWESLTVSKWEHDNFRDSGHRLMTIGYSRIDEVTLARNGVDRTTWLTARDLG